MSFLIKHTDGSVHEVTDSRTITKDELNADVEQKTIELAKAEKRVAEYDAINSPLIENATTVEVPAEVPTEVVADNLTELPVTTAQVETATVTEQPIAPVAELIQPTAIPIQ